MHRLTLIVTAFVAVPLMVAGVATAKRMAPREVGPITIDGVEYSAPHFASCREKTRSCYSVRAERLQDAKVRWECDVYYVDYEPSLEQDVQDVFITKLRAEPSRLLIENEKGEHFTLDLRTGNVSMSNRQEGSRTRARSEPCLIRDLRVQAGD